MKINRRHFMGGLAVGAAGLAAVRPSASPGLVLPRPPVPAQPVQPPSLLDRARASLDAHAARIAHRDIVGLVDFSQASGVPRFRLIDLANGGVISTHLVAHGRGSDPSNTGWLQHFSNRNGSNASCRGSFLTGGTYVGRHGRSRRLLGLDPDNNNAAQRAIVIHAADYVSEEMADSHGRVGRSQGCFAVPQPEIGTVLNRLGEGRLLLAWK